MLPSQRIAEPGTQDPHAAGPTVERPALAALMAWCWLASISGTRRRSSAMLRDAETPRVTRAVRADGHQRGRLPGRGRRARGGRIRWRLRVHLERSRRPGVSLRSQHAPTGLPTGCARVLVRELRRRRPTCFIWSTSDGRGCLLALPLLPSCRQRRQLPHRMLKVAGGGVRTGPARGPAAAPLGRPAQGHAQGLSQAPCAQADPACVWAGPPTGAAAGFRA